MYIQGWPESAHSGTSITRLCLQDHVIIIILDIDISVHDTNTYVHVRDSGVLFSLQNIMWLSILRILS